MASWQKKEAEPSGTTGGNPPGLAIVRDRPNGQKPGRRAIAKRDWTDRRLTFRHGFDSLGRFSNEQDWRVEFPWVLRDRHS